MGVELSKLPNNSATANAIKNIFSKKDQSGLADKMAKLIDSFYDCRENGYNSDELKTIKKQVEEFLAVNHTRLSSEENELMGDIRAQCKQAGIDKSQRRQDVNRWLDTKDGQEAWTQFVALADKYNSNLKIDHVLNATKNLELKTKSYKFATTEANPDKPYLIDADKFINTLNKVVTDALADKKDIDDKSNRT